MPSQCPNCGAMMDLADDQCPECEHDGCDDECECQHCTDEREKEEDAEDEEELEEEFDEDLGGEG